jgi:2-iminobutanoate/2-iminopropanoate deaminase
MDMIDRVAVFTELAPRPAGGYSQAIVYGGVVYVAGQLPIDPARGPRGQGALADEPLATVAEQTRRVLANVEAVLKAAGSDLSRVLRCTVYVSDVSLWSEVNRAYCEVFAAAGVGGEGGVGGVAMPARTVVPTGPLHYGYQVEMEVVAAVE